MSGKLKSFVEASENRSLLCVAVGIDETLLSRMLKGTRGASAAVIEKFYKFSGLPLSESWEVIDEEDA